VRGTPLERFWNSSRVSARQSTRERAALPRRLARLASALRLFPQTTEQLLHIDKFLQRERALPVRLPTRIGDWRLSASETFGELDVRSLLRRSACPCGRRCRRLGRRAHRALRLADRTDDRRARSAVGHRRGSAEWRAAVTRYVGAAFPAQRARDCPPLDGCWSSTWDVAAGVLGSASVFASGPSFRHARAALLTQI
jgi:hypothetical protein